MATLVPTLLVRQRMRRGGLSGEAATRTAWHAVVRALLVAAAVSLGAWGVQALLFADGAGIDRGAVLIGKTLYGAALGAIVTAVAVKVAICESGIQ